MHQIRFRLGLRPRPAGEAYSAPPDPQLYLKGPTSKGRDKRGRDRREGGGWERRGEGRGRREEGKGNLPPLKFRSGYAMVSVSEAARSQRNNDEPRQIRSDRLVGRTINRAAADVCLSGVFDASTARTDTRRGLHRRRRH